MGYLASQQTLLQGVVADEYRGRIFGALGTTTALLGLVGMGLGGYLGDRVGLMPVLNVAGGLWVAGGALALLTLQNTRNEAGTCTASGERSAAATSRDNNGE